MSKRVTSAAFHKLPRPIAQYSIRAAQRSQRSKKQKKVQSKIDPPMVISAQNRPAQRAPPRNNNKEKIMLRPPPRIPPRRKVGTGASSASNSIARRTEFTKPTPAQAKKRMHTFSTQPRRRLLKKTVDV